jgi:hypothetical protein
MPVNLDRRVEILEEKRRKVEQNLRDLKAKQAEKNRRERTGQLIALGLVLDGQIRGGKIGREQLLGMIGESGVDERQRTRIEAYLGRVGDGSAEEKEEDQGGAESQQGVVA